MPTSGGVRLSGGPVWTDNETSVQESDVSSVIDISEDMVETTDEEYFRGAGHLHDTSKYRMPDIGKTRLDLMTKEPLTSPPPSVPVLPTRQEGRSTPTTPRTMHPVTNEYVSSPPKPSFSTNWPNSSVENMIDGELVSSGISRAGSIYTLGRASLTGQLSQLTSMRLPDAGSLANRISSIPTSAEAAKSLSDASEQIRVWVGKALEVLNGLRAEDDVEWSAAGGRDGIDDVDQSINRFEQLVQVYVLSIEKLQTREDISELPAEDLTSVVKQMESIIASWQKIKTTLNGVKEQVEIAMEWERLWNSVLGEVGQEMEALGQLVFEMEEKRHQGAENLIGPTDSIDLNELETIVEEQPARPKMYNRNRLSIASFPLISPAQVPTVNHENQDDSNLLALFARMQPLRASLDFLPMQLSAFNNRANPIFPTACLDLERRRDQLEAQWKKLETDAEGLRRELGEDRWVIVFRNAGRQALKMCESIVRSHAKLKDAVDAGEQETDIPSLMKKVENYEAKKTHYGPAIERVLAIIDRGVLDRLTVNGEILRLQSEMKQRWTSLQADLRAMDAVIADFHNDSKDKQLRDSVSTVMSSERSIASSFLDTPGSSPASSVLGLSRKNSFQGSRTPTPLNHVKVRSSSNSSNTKPASRLSSVGSIARKSLLASGPGASNSHSSPASSPASASQHPKAPAWPSRSEVKPTNRPRWINTTKTNNPTFRPLSAFEPSPYAKTPAKPKTSYLRATTSRNVTPSPRRDVSLPNPAISAPSPDPASSNTPARKSSLPVPTSTPSRAKGALGSKASTPTLRPSSRLSNGRRSSLLSRIYKDGNDADTESLSLTKRSPSGLSGSVPTNGERSSLLPTRVRSRQSDLSAQDDKPKWRP